MQKLVIIPTYNERENIAAIIERISGLPERFDILVVDDNSPDGTASIVRDIQKNSPPLQGGVPSQSEGEVVDRNGEVHLLERTGKLGLGSAYIAGFGWALERDYDWIFEMDADFSHNPDDLVRLYHKAIGKECDKGEFPSCGGVPRSGGVVGADVVVGSRYVTGVNVVNWPMSRLMMSWLASKYVRFVTRMPVRDATAGFVCYSRKALQAIDLDAVKMHGYGFQIEMKYTAWRLGFTIAEVSIIFIDRTLGTSKMSSGIFSEAFWGVLGLPLRHIARKKFMIHDS